MTERKKSTGATSSDDRLADLESRIVALEDVNDVELARARYRHDERERTARVKAEWDARLPERLKVFRERFVGKRLVLGRGRSIFVGFVVRAYHEFCIDSEASCRAPSSQEVAQTEAKAFQRGDRFFKMPERSTPVAVDPAMELTIAELEAAILNLSGVQAGQGTNIHGVEQPIYEGLSLKDNFAYDGCSPMSQMAAPTRLVVA